MWFDHLCAKQLKPFGELYEELAEVKNRLKSLENPEKSKKTIKTLTEKIEVKDND